VLGLMKTQMTKNAVIVPVGSKGGFVVKGAPTDRDALRAFVEAQYRTYVRALLGLTDNIVGGEVVHPEGLVIHDEDDPYLVVAADKGTATFSDTANAVAAEMGFWLGDAFASGGSVGYDHKKEGITARGTWAAIERHFRDVGIDPARDPFTVSASATCRATCSATACCTPTRSGWWPPSTTSTCSSTPTPTPPSFAERRRLFELPRSSWADYDRDLISAGGGVFERAAKRIPLSPQVRARLGVDAEALSGQDLVRRSCAARSTCCGTAASGPTSRPAASATPTSATPATTACASTRPSCARGSSARAATSGSPSSPASSTPARAAGSTPTRSTTRGASPSPTTRSTSS
jgi:glutamate dehydrogenase